VSADRRLVSSPVLRSVKESRRQPDEMGEQIFPELRDHQLRCGREEIDLNKV